MRRCFTPWENASGGCFTVTCSWIRPTTPIGMRVCRQVRFAALGFRLFWRHCAQRKCPTCSMWRGVMATTLSVAPTKNTCKPSLLIGDGGSKTAKRRDEGWGASDEKWSGRPDLNRRPWAPDAHALTKLRHAPNLSASQILAIAPSGVNQGGVCSENAFGRARLLPSRECRQIGRWAGRQVRQKIGAPPEVRPPIGLNFRTHSSRCSESLRRNG